MLGSNEVSEEQLATLSLTKCGIDYIIKADKDGPAKSVRSSRKNNLVGQTPLIENGVSLQFQSASGENIFLAYLQFRRDLWIVLDQPTTVGLEIVDVNNKPTRTTYTPDFLTVDKDGAIAYEIKDDAKLSALCATRPVDWTRDEVGFHYLPAERFFAKLGIQHKTIANSELNPVRAKNIRLICSHRDAPDTEQLRHQKSKVCRLVRSKGAIKAADLLKTVKIKDLTAILQLIDEGEIFAPLDLSYLVETNSLWLAVTQERADELTTNDRLLATMLREQRVIEGNELPPGAYINDIAARYSAIQGNKPLNPRTNLPYSSRATRRFKQAFRESKGNILSLSPGWSRCGDRGPRLSPTHEALLEKIIRTGRGDTNDPTIANCWRLYTEAFFELKSNNLESDAAPIRQYSFERRWRGLGGHAEDARAKGGRRLENAVRVVYDAQNRVTVALRAFEAAHIDHWLADFFVYVTTINGERIVRRPWVTAMIDGYDKEILAIWMSLDAPSRKANCMVMRECALRHGRLPETIVTDGGSDFLSHHFGDMLCFVNVEHIQRPPENPGFGQEVESLFALLKVKLARGLPGFVFSIEQGRKISASFKAANKATLTLLEAWDLVKLFAFTIYNESVRASGSLDSPIKRRLSSLELFPMSGRLVIPNVAFMVITAVDAYAKDYTLHSGRGIKVNNVWFSHPELTKYRGYKKSVRVRIEPYDPSIVYVSLKDKWYVCFSPEARINALKSDTSLQDAAYDKYEVNAIRKEIMDQQSREAAKIVNDKLNEIIVANKEATKKAPIRNTSANVSQSGDEAKGSISKRKHNALFDELEPYT